MYSSIENTRCEVELPLFHLPEESRQISMNLKRQQNRIEQGLKYE